MIATPMRGLGVHGGRWQSLGGAHRRFLPLGIEIHWMRDLGVANDRLDGALP